MYCTKCGMELSDGYEFCPRCGNKVAGTAIESDRNGFQAGSSKWSVYKKSILAGAIAVLLIIIGIVIVIVMKSPLAGKWYDMKDDDYWLDIGNNTIIIRDVFSDEVYGTIDYSYNKSDKKIITEKMEAGTKSIKYVKELAGFLSRNKVFVENSMLCVEYMNGRKTEIIKFSSDSTYKRDY